MKNKGMNFIGRMFLLTAFLSAGSGFAFAATGAEMTPALAAKKEVVRKQQDQRITDEKRKTAAKALKEMRIKVHKAKQNASQPVLNSTDSK